MGNALFSIASRNIYKAGIALFVVFLAVIPVIAPAQNDATKNKIKPRNSTKVFYGQASYYANLFVGKRTANGEIFSQKKFTCACNVLPLGTWIKVTNLRNGKTVIVKTNDRIHPRMKRVVDLSRAAAHQLGFINRGVTRVKIEIVDRKKYP